MGPCMRATVLLVVGSLVLFEAQRVRAQDDPVDDALGLTNDAADDGAAQADNEQVDFDSSDLGDSGADKASPDDVTKAALGEAGAATQAGSASTDDDDSHADDVLEQPRADAATTAPDASAASAQDKQVYLLSQPGHENMPGQHPALLPLVAMDPGVAPKRVALLEHLLTLALQGRADMDVVDLRRALEPGSGQDALRLIERATELYHAGRQAYENLDSDQATEQLSAACNTFEAGYAGVRDPHTMAITHVYLASLYMQNGQPEKGAPYYRRALFLEPGLELDINVFAPEDIDALEAQRSLIRSSQKGRVEVRSLPVSSRVYIDNVFRGSSPLEVEGLAPGRHFLRLERDGYERVADVIEIKNGQLAHVEQRMIPLRGMAELRHLLVLVEPDSADLGGVLKPLGLLFSSSRAVMLTGHLADKDQLQVQVHYVDLRSGLRLRHVQGLLPRDSAAAAAKLRALADSALDVSAGVESGPSEPLLDLSGLEDVQIPWMPVLAGLGGVAALGALGAGTCWLVAGQPPESRPLQGGERTVVLGF